MATLLLLLFLRAEIVQGQVNCLPNSNNPSLLSKFNLVVFGGYWARQQNLNNNGNYRGVYVDWVPYKSADNSWSAGIYGLASRSEYSDNLTKYSSTNNELATGVTAGYYSYGFTSKYQLFLGFSLGIKYNSDEGESIRKIGRYSGEQKDYLLAGNLNFNLLKEDGPTTINLPRTQITLSGQVPVKSERKAQWNNQDIKGNIWDKTYYDLTAKQSLVSWQWLKRCYLSPKLMLSYVYSCGDTQSYFSFGGELSFHKIYNDDFFSISFMYKCNKAFDNNQLMVWANINFARL